MKICVVRTGYIGLPTVSTLMYEDMRQWSSFTATLSFCTD